MFNESLIDLAWQYDKRRGVIEADEERLRLKNELISGDGEGAVLADMLGGLDLGVDLSDDETHPFTPGQRSVQDLNDIEEYPHALCLASIAQGLPTGGQKTKRGLVLLVHQYFTHAKSDEEFHALRNRRWLAIACMESPFTDGQLDPDKVMSGILQVREGSFSEEAERYMQYMEEKYGIK